MIDDPSAIEEALPKFLFERVRRLNQHPLNLSGEFVLYWMHHAARGHENPALDTAIFIANRYNLPVIVYQGLGGHHLYNSDRHHAFIMEGARDVREQLNARGVSYFFHLAKDPKSTSPLKGLMKRAAITLSEDFPAPPFPSWSKSLANASPAAFWVVDTACIIPMQLLKKPYGRAYQFRKDTLDEFERRAQLQYEDIKLDIRPFRGTCGFKSVDLSNTRIADLCASCQIDHSIGRVSHTKGGSTAGYERWEQFKQFGLNSYANQRNDAAVKFPMGVSRMSAYLHHGHVSPYRLTREVAGSKARGAAKFLDELLIWRELAHNFCFYHHPPGVLQVLPSWAIQTLNEHRRDRREAVFTWEQLARAKTGDVLWDAAQKSVLIHGELHNNLRMTWGKALLKWTRSPEEALEMMIDLNHRYALDGSDPNSYGGILWCLGLFDRPFKPPKRVIGTLRPRSTRSHAERLDLSAYTKRISKPTVHKAKHIAIIGAGISGLMAARTLADSGHTVTVFEKARGPGGRMSTRRITPYAFDHGAQYFTVRDNRFRILIESWRQYGLIQRWKGRIRVLGNGEILKENRPHKRYVGVPGMSALGRHLAVSLSIHWKTSVKQVSRDGAKIILKNEQSEHLGSYDALIASAPAEQSAQLMAEFTHLAEKAAAIEMDPCWAVMLAFREPLNLPFDGAFIQKSPLIWAARNSSKPGRGIGDCWVLHAGAAWSQEHLGLDTKEVIHQLTASFFEATHSDASEPVFEMAHRWRYARARYPLNEGCLWDSHERIGLCGDWCHNSRIEGAFLSGTAMAGRILGTVETWP